ncbi:UNVERIFIED_CONTAM: hypothetical protein ABIC26_000337 [Paenibacillus sp. PvR008]
MLIQIPIYINRVGNVYVTLRIHNYLINVIYFNYDYIIILDLFQKYIR